MIIHYLPSFLYFYNVSKFVIFSVHLSQIPSVFLPPSLPFSFPSVPPFFHLLIFLHHLHLPFSPLPLSVSVRTPLFCISFPPSISPSIPTTPSPSSVSLRKRTQPGLAPLIAFRKRKRDSQCIKLRKPIPLITTTAVRSDLRSGHLIFVDSAPPPSFPSWIIVLKLSLTTNHEVQ